MLRGRVINGGVACGEAFVLEEPFSFIGDFDPETGVMNSQKPGLVGQSIANKILVFPIGKGGTIAPWVAYEAAKNKNAPLAILCQQAEPITCEVAITIDIPLLDSFEVNIVQTLKTGQRIKIDGNTVSILE
jgi:predicted aconitase with swiveling domain